MATGAAGASAANARISRDTVGSEATCPNITGSAQQHDIGQTVPPAASAIARSSTMFPRVVAGARFPPRCQHRAELIGLADQLSAAAAEQEVEAGSAQRRQCGGQPYVRGSETRAAD